MKALATLAAIIMVLTACDSVPSATTTSSAAQPAAMAATTSSALAKPADQGVATAKRTQICESEESTGSRLKRPRCHDVPDGNDKASRGDILKDNLDELRALDERTALGR